MQVFFWVRADDGWSVVIKIGFWPRHPLTSEVFEVYRQKQTCGWFDVKSEPLYVLGCSTGWQSPDNNCAATFPAADWKTACTCHRRAPNPRLELPPEVDNGNQKWLCIWDLTVGPEQTTKIASPAEKTVNDRQTCFCVRKTLPQRAPRGVRGFSLWVAAD